MKDDRFEVALRFSGRETRLVVPFNAIKAFWDKAELKCSGNCFRDMALDCFASSVMT